MKPNTDDIFLLSLMIALFMLDKHLKVREHIETEIKFVTK